MPKFYLRGLGSNLRQQNGKVDALLATLSLEAISSYSAVLFATMDWRLLLHVMMFLIVLQHLRHGKGQVLIGSCCHMGRS
eukprot:6490662-Amphidinium_carterae.2